jgi:ATP phosphoribosyltransferase regulatory subunit HisZ
MAPRRPRQVQAALGALRSHMSKFGYVPADVPIIQRSDLFLTRAGDQILHKLFTFERHGVSLALRPEFTTPALHRYIADHLYETKTVARWQVAGIIFEDDPADGSTNFERASSGAECIGLAGAAAEAEIIAMAAEGCSALGKPVERIVLGDARLLHAVLSAHNLDVRVQRFVLSHVGALTDPERGADYILERFDAQLAAPSSSLNTDSQDVEEVIRAILVTNERGRAMGGRTQPDIARRLVQRQQRAAQRQPLQDALRLLAHLAKLRTVPSEAIRLIMSFPGAELWDQTLQNWREVIALLDVYGYPESCLQLVPILARDWEYYSGVMFELYDARGSHVAGGGRYDEFARLIGAPCDIPAVGFTYYLDALLHEMPSSSTPHVWTILADHDLAQAVGWAQSLRHKGIPIQINHVDPAGSRELRLNDDGTLSFGDVRYTFAELESLVEAINGKQR